MRVAGYALISVGFLAGSLVAVQTAENEVDWSWYVPAFLVGVAGIVIVHRAIRAETREEGALGANLQAISESLQRIAQNARQLDADKESIDVYDLHGRIDEIFRDDMATFVEGRESIAHLHGLAAYAEVMNEFAAGERYLNRVWSASIDGWIDEARQYITLAREQFDGAASKLRALAPGSTA